MRTFSLAHIGGEADEFSVRRPSRRRVANLRSFLELHFLEKQIGYQPSQP